mmetsp:Transcript_89408/g.208164  ORF Transcript_89408/g.208164 Transcript_89408/m.208164 type:complete len:236 (+) Transcript_89408:840-1547(+)
MLDLPVEVEAEAARKARQRSFVVFVPGSARHEFQFHDLLALQLVLHKEPVGDAAVRGDREEVQCAARDVVIPAHLPDGVSVLVGAHGALVDWLLRPGAHVVDKHRAVIEAHCQHCWVRRVPVKGANAEIGVENILWEACVLQGVAADDARALPQEVVGAETHGTQVVVPRVPLDGRHLLPLCLLRGETPERQQCALALTVLIALVLPVFEVVVNRKFGVLVHHPLHDAHGEAHAL